MITRMFIFCMGLILVLNSSTYAQDSLCNNQRGHHTTSRHHHIFRHPRISPNYSSSRYHTRPHTRHTYHSRTLYHIGPHKYHNRSTYQYRSGSRHYSRYKCHNTSRYRSGSRYYSVHRHHSTFRSHAPRTHRHRPYRLGPRHYRHR